MAIEEFLAIDAHAHFGPFRNSRWDSINALRSADAGEIVRRARLARTGLSIVSPMSALMPRLHGDPVGGNDEAAHVVADTPGLRQWVVVDPRNPRTYAQAAALLPLPTCLGIKIHPEEHGYPIREHGDALFAFAAEQGAVVQSHSGEANSLPEDFLPFADAYPGVRLLLSHLGFCEDGDPSHQVRAILAARHGNIWTDTSSAMSMTPGLLEWAVGEVGPTRVLFGTDSPCYFAPMQRARIDAADLDEATKRCILRENALALFRLPADVLPADL